MGKIVGSTTVTPPPIPDWNQTDATKGDYIKNKPKIPSTEEVVNAVLEALPTWEGGSY